MFNHPAQDTQCLLFIFYWYYLLNTFFLIISLLLMGGRIGWTTPGLIPLSFRDRSFVHILNILPEYWRLVCAQLIPHLPNKYYSNSFARNIVYRKCIICFFLVGSLSEIFSLQYLDIILICRAKRPGPIIQVLTYPKCILLLLLLLTQGNFIKNWQIIAICVCVFNLDKGYTQNKRSFYYLRVFSLRLRADFLRVKTRDLRDR